VVAVGRSRRSVHQKLRLLDVLEIYVLADPTLNLGLLNILEERRLVDVEISVFVEKVLGCP